MTPSEGRALIFAMNPDAEIVYTPWSDFDGNVIGDDDSVTTITPHPIYGEVIDVGHPPWMIDG